MCGICGIVETGGKPDRGLLDRMVRVLRHRGPDAEGVEIMGACGLGHSRLAVIDVPGGAQPLSNEDGTVSVVYNGEIYNFRELRSELESKGHAFRSRSDTEVIVHLYEEQGPELVSRLRGMFAFALWDSKAKELMLARDRGGVKPLYYRAGAGRLVFASELKAVLQDPAVPRELDGDAFDLYLTYGCVPSPRTIFRGVRKLPPAHFLLFEPGSDEARPKRYWRLQQSPKKGGGFEGTLRRTDEAIREAVRCRLVSDRPVGVFLSGGIDSSLVAAAVADESDEKLPCFTMGFEEAGFDERPFARGVAKELGADLREFSIRPDAVEVLPRLAWHFDEPFGDSSALASWYLAEQTAGEVTVVLTGDGGDESFAGYERYAGLGLARGWRLLPGFCRRAAGRLLEKLGAGRRRRGALADAKRLNDATLTGPRRTYASIMSVFAEDDRAAIYSRDFAATLGGENPLDHLPAIEAQSDSREYLDRASYADIASYLPDDVLVKVDRTTMAFGLEARSPFLDTPLVEMAARVPNRLKISWLRPKMILRELVRRRFGRRLAARRKAGFAVPVGEWFRYGLANTIEDIVAEGTLVRDGILRREGVRAMIDAHASREAEHGARLWSLLAAEAWYRSFMKRAELDGPLGSLG